MAKKEMHYFGSDLHFGTQFYRRNLEAYLREFDGRNTAPRVGEASVWYLLSRRAAAEIHAFNPGSRIIIMLREPSEMLYSLYYQFCYDGNEHLPTFEEALEAEKERRAGRRIGRQAYFPQGLVYRDAARYTEQVRRYYEVFGRHRVQVVIYDDFAADAAAAYRATLDFLAVDSTRRHGELKVLNGNKTVRHPTIRAVLQDPMVRATAIAMESWLPRPMFAALQRAESRVQRFNSRPAKRPALSPETRAQLKAELAPEIERLSDLLERDLTYWSK